MYTEVNHFKAALDAMFRAAGQGVVFVETVMHRARKTHTVVDAVPLDAEVAADAPMYAQPRWGWRGRVPW